MQLSNAASAITSCEGHEFYVYYGWEDETIPRDVTHVRIYSSVKAIKKRAFMFCSKLLIVILNDGLNKIEELAFHYCESLQRIIIPNTVKTIRYGAFQYCSGLVTVSLDDGLEEIEAYAFDKCISLQGIFIPNTVKIINCGAFSGCSGLTTVTLCEGLEKIGEGAFTNCTSIQCIILPDTVKLIQKWAFIHCSGLTAVSLGDGLEEIEQKAFNMCTSLNEINILSTIKAIDESAFNYCSSLTRVRFCDKVEEFISSFAMQNWWEIGCHQKSLLTYFFLVKRSIPERLMGLSFMSSWQVCLYNMLGSIPTIAYGYLDAYFDTIDVKLTTYENLWNEAPMLIQEQFGIDDSLVMKILSFL